MDSRICFNKQFLNRARTLVTFHIPYSSLYFCLMSSLGPVFHVYQIASASNTIYTRFFNAICFIVVGKEELVDFVSEAGINDIYTDLH